MGSLFSKSTALRKGVKITDEEFVQLRDFIYGKSGIFVDEKRKYLFESRFSRRLGELGLTSFTDYIKFLKVDRGQELKQLFEMVTTNETSFWRDTKQLTSFRDNLLKEILDRQRKAGKLELNIWSAGCSSGEEPYTLVFLLLETLKAEIARWRINITAVDLSEEMIAKARAGIYSEYAFKTTPDETRKRYFKEVEGGWELDQRIRRLVKFEPMNLNDPLAIKRIPRSHIVFCRNVIIYFDDAMKRKVVQAFYDNLLPGGYLLVGHSESLHKISQSFKPIHNAGAIAYKKEE
ncbi:CheR family methyltransferase [Pseudodesulfovibrio karagichevae]|uniref:protein-glutamate O-methyltransferase n=1 Tax=Pseudodesulfovibrio karagichevae TaxID=3239305 RepID=A0ABV4K8I1_9BACT